MTTAQTTTKEDNYNLFYNTIKSLASSQGFYSRLAQQIDEFDSDTIENIKNDLPIFNDALGVILFLEQ